MRCLFVHDFRSYTRDNEVYTGNLSYEIWQDRYIRYFDTVKVLNRSEAMKETDNPNKFVKASGPNIEFLNEIDVFTPLSFAKNYKRYKKTVYHHVDESDYVIIRLDSFLGLIAAKRCRNKEKKYLIEVVGCVWDSFWNKGAFGKVVALPLFLKMKYEIKNAPYVVYVTTRFLQKRYPTKGQNTNISNVFLPEHDDSILEKRLYRIENSDQNVLQIATIASVSVRYKGQDAVIRALGDLKKYGNQRFVYHLIGGGDESYLRGVAKQYEVEEQIVFHGSMNHDEVIDFLDDCDVYIQPSKQEGLPRALIEAMSRGLLCFGTRVAGIPELLDENMLFSKRSQNHKEIATLLDSIDRNMQMKQAVRNFNESKKYEQNVLANRRKVFFSNFRDS